MFSNDAVADFINERFEPAWESLRPVPVVRIDFGNGKTVSKTLSGNIATCVCTSEGDVLDVIPGIYTPEVYKQKLNQLGLVFQFSMEEDVKVYHRRQAAALKNEKLTDAMELKRFAGGASIFGRERAIKLVLRGEDAAPVPHAAPPAPKGPRLESKQERDRWQLLAEDTVINETVRRRKIHEMLAESGPVPVAKITKRLFKEVLNTDLDDPYLGLEKVLFGRP